MSKKIYKAFKVQVKNLSQWVAHLEPARVYFLPTYEYLRVTSFSIFL